MTLGQFPPLIFLIHYNMHYSLIAFVKQKLLKLLLKKN